MTEPDDLVATDPEARLADSASGGALRLGGNVECNQHHRADGEEERAEYDARDLVGALLIDRQALGELRRDELRGRFRRAAVQP